ncbi:MAG: UvrB/UvrC motif-containing protein [Kiritimatiellae bacterium]|nr:UvrB/UvrC motif-containing protein [Kiritimatiellia bacterium]
MNSASVLREADEKFDIHEAIQDIEREMLEAAEALEFERAAMLRDQLFELKNALKPGSGRALIPSGRSRLKASRH